MPPRKTASRAQSGEVSGRGRSSGRKVKNEDPVISQPLELSMEEMEPKEVNKDESRSTLGLRQGQALTLAFSLVIRLALIAFGEWQDERMIVKYTDVDYVVFTDAARFVSEGMSPYARATYRYTPFLAMFLTPNVLVHPIFGKLVFALFDIVIGLLLISMLQQRKANWKWAAFYLFNPIVINTSTRGNAESIIAVLVVASLYCFFRKNLTLLGSVLFGLSVHVKIYPIIYALPIYFFMDSNYTSLTEEELDARSRKKMRKSAPLSPVESCEHGIPLKQCTVCSVETDESEYFYWFLRRRMCPSPFHFAGRGFRNFHRAIVGVFPSWLQSLFSERRILFFLVSASTFLSLTGLTYIMYGYHAIYETYLYHFVRTDNRHNFSVYFYHLYLQYGLPKGFVSGVLAFLPQLLLLVALGIRYYRDITFCVTAQTMVFVAFNKVCTVQYFVWYMSLLPLVMPSSSMGILEAGVLGTLWLGAQGLWLAIAFQLEFLGKNVFLPLWGATLGFFVVNLIILVEMVRHHRSSPVFENGCLTPVVAAKRKTE